MVGQVLAELATRFVFFRSANLKASKLPCGLAQQAGIMPSANEPIETQDAAPADTVTWGRELLRSVIIFMRNAFHFIMLDQHGLELLHYRCEKLRKIARCWGKDEQAAKDDTLWEINTTGKNSRM